MLSLPPRLSALRNMPALGDWLNQFRDYVSSLGILSASGIEVRRTTAGLALIVPPPEVSTVTQTGALKRFRVLNVRVDFALECVEEGADGMIPTDLTNVRRTYVAMPAVFRSSTYNNVVVRGVKYEVSGSVQERIGKITDVQTDTDVPFTQYIDPEYLPHNNNNNVPELARIYAMQVSNLTDWSITASDYPGVTPPVLRQLNWIDVNIDSRHWAPLANLADFCVGGNNVAGIVFGKVP